MVPMKSSPRSFPIRLNFHGETDANVKTPSCPHNFASPTPMCDGLGIFKHTQGHLSSILAINLILQELKANPLHQRDQKSIGVSVWSIIWSVKFEFLYSFIYNTKSLIIENALKICPIHIPRPKSQSITKYQLFIDTSHNFGYFPLQ